MKYGRCKLCLKETNLCESHIYPKFFVKHVRDKKYDNKFQYLSNTIVKSPPQDGPKYYLLCKKCEKHIKVYEDHYKKLFFDKKDLKFIYKNEDIIEIKGYDYKKIRLFLLSLLWRLSISPISNWNINLNKNEQELLRQQIINDVPKSYDFFPFYTFLIQIDGKNESSFFMNPFEASHPIGECIIIYIFGILYMFSKKHFNKEFGMSNSLTPERWICNVKNINDVHFLMEKLDSLKIKN